MQSWHRSNWSCCSHCSVLQTASNPLEREAGRPAVTWPPWVRSHWLHCLAESQLLSPLSATARLHPKAPSLLQRKVQTWNLCVCVALVVVPGWGPCCCLSATVSLWEVQLRSNSAFRKWTKGKSSGFFSLCFLCCVGLQEVDDLFIYLPLARPWVF